jgi:tRNA(fMet)-specific endonuclease VapC
MIYLLDTDLLIFMIRGLKTRGRAARNRDRAEMLMNRCRNAQAVGDSVALSAATVSELEFGARNNGKYEEEIAAVRKVLAPFDVLDYDGLLCPQHYGEVRHALEAKGMAIGSMDLLIVAHALALGGTLVTNNTAHFSRVGGLRIANWLKSD